MPRSETIRSMLVEGRVPLAIGRVCEVAALVLAQPKKAAALIECLWDEDPGIANRAADVLERVTRQLPSILEPWKAALLGLMDEATQNKLRWNLALMIARMPLTVPEARRAARALQSYLEDRSSIVKTAAMQGLADLTRHDPSLLPEVLDQLRILSRTGTAAMRARGRILLKQMEPGGKRRALERG
jgi:HEAT repeat protein